MQLSRFHDSLVHDKNHNPRKGTETSGSDPINAVHIIFDKNHNPRKGTETNSNKLVSCAVNTLEIRTIIPARGRKPALPFLLM